MENIKIKRALISVSDKSGLLTLATALLQYGCEIISTGGTAGYLMDNGIEVTDISTVTGNPEAFNGRMKTISFQVASALLFKRHRDSREAEMLNIKPIDMVVCNLYPFIQYKDTVTELEELVEYIDIGGPTMLRAAAKNYESVASVCNSGSYPAIVEELSANDGALTFETRKKLMTETFAHTAYYDSAISDTLAGFMGREELTVKLERVMQPRYGENSHQNAGFYKVAGTNTGLWNIEVLGGIELSYNNILDLNAALEAVSLLGPSGCAIVKHNNTCGYAEGAPQSDVFIAAWECDSISAFGGIVAFNEAVTLDTVQYLNYGGENKDEKKFIEIIAAPGFTDEALEYLRTQKKLRIVRWSPSMLSADKEIRVFNNSALIQNKDRMLFEKITQVSGPEFPIDSITDVIEFGIKSVMSIKSNAISLVRKTQGGILQVCGKGVGQPNRVNSVNLCLEQAAGVLGKTNFADEENLVLISDAFFPFEDNIDFAHKAGIKIIVQPGGSIRDKHIIERCNEYGIVMFFTGTRHFKH